MIVSHTLLLMESFSYLKIRKIYGGELIWSIEQISQSEMKRLPKGFQDIGYTEDKG